MNGLAPATLTQRHADSLASWADATDAAAVEELRGRPSPVTDFSARVRELGRRLSRHAAGEAAGFTRADLDLLDVMAPLAARAMEAPEFRDPRQLRLAEDVLAIREFLRRRIDG